MRTISDTIARLTAMNGATSFESPVGATRLADLSDFGSNPGALDAHIYLPAGLAPHGALVVVLHGCTQTAARYNHGSGWSDLADRCGFALLFPEQRRANNANLCFNWFEPDDTRRGSGEALSIREMIAAMVERHGLDPERVFVTGLSAGGAMASVMLATYPEVFGGGAIIAGLPYGAAAGVSQALDRMRGRGLPDAAALTTLVRQASAHNGPWPMVSIWHGTVDATVSSANADAIIAQWRTLHGVGAAPGVSDMIDGVPHRVWFDRDGRAVIEDYRITGMGHGTPLDTQGDQGYGVAGAHMLEANISSTQRIAQSWGIAEPGSASRPTASPNSAKGKVLAATDTGVGTIIEGALRAAGLMS
jgi:poly(hydroxyalkanoate) depolymerase family esterase